MIVADSKYLCHRILLGGAFPLPRTLLENELGSLDFLYKKNTKFAYLQ